MEINWAELQDYRLKEIEEGASFIADIWKDRESPEYFRGAMDMLDRILHIPKSLCEPTEKEFVSDMVAQDFKRVEMSLLRKVVR